MRTIFIVMDSLNRDYLSCYGNNWVKTPNINRLANQGIVFDNHFCGSLPCMPARREMFTGRLNFLEGLWGPIEPWDDCLPVELRKQKNTYSHLITDHHHYFHSGGEGYHTLFNSWEYFRGQSNDKWRPLVKEPDTPEYIGRNGRNYWNNIKFMDLEKDEDYSGPQCFIQAIDFLKNNHQQDNWHLHLEVFDPHEPFTCPSKYLEMYNDTWDNRYHFDWPNYRPVKEEPDAVKHIQKQYAGLLTMTDTWLGKFLDKMDELDMWDDTTVILTTDHGHLLGEHGYWAKNYMFDYKELVNIPLIIYSPENKGKNHRVSALTATIDIMPTLMEIHQAKLPPNVHGKSLVDLLQEDSTHHDTVLYGYFNKDINMFDGQYTYCRQSLPGSTVYHHTIMPRNYSDFLDRKDLASAELGPFLPKTHGIPHFRIQHQTTKHMNAPEYNIIHDIINDPEQNTQIHDQQLEHKLANKMQELLIKYEAPDCQFTRTGLKRSNSKDELS